ncbi:PP98 [Orf virus]|uniref:PP98 n=1 Tax=Orf virus TaxID=10258 RepID=F1AX17_ORFV|nr:PP98 [Orf virus]
MRSSPAAYRLMNSTTSAAASGSSASCVDSRMGRVHRLTAALRTENSGKSVARRSDSTLTHMPPSPGKKSQPLASAASLHRYSVDSVGLNA